MPAPPTPPPEPPPERARRLVARSAPPPPAAPAVTTPEPTVEEPKPDPAAAERMRRLVARSSVIPAPVEDDASARRAGCPRPRRAVRRRPSPPGWRRSSRSPSGPGAPTCRPSCARNREDIRRTGITVAVVGEFKKGKSTLVNALVNAEVCPADPVYASIAPISRRPRRGVHGHAHVRRRAHGDRRRSTPSQLAEVASEEGNDGNHLGLGRVDVTLPRRLLAAGLHLVDMPGVGGLDSAIGALNLASLDAADGVVFVTDCTQELTAPELAFLVAAGSAVPGDGVRDDQASTCSTTRRR